LEDERTLAEAKRQQEAEEWAARLASFTADQEALEKQKEDMELQRQSQELHSRLATESITTLDEELRKKAEELQEREALLRAQMLHSRGQLAMVQARVMNMIDKTDSAPKGDVHLQINQGLDEDDEPEGEGTAAEDADMWDMDWSKAVAREPGSADADA